jgi:sugar phosphate isomerase/epimerase
VRDVYELRDLKREYVELVRTYGEEVTEFKPFRQSLLELNRRHRLEAMRMYVKIISKIEKKMGRKK